MTDEEKILKMFIQVHGEPTGACSTQVTYDEDGHVNGVSLMKYGHEVWHAHRDLLVFQCMEIGEVGEPPSGVKGVIKLLRDALDGTELDDVGNRDDDGLRFACQMGWLQGPHRIAVGRVSDALKLLEGRNETLLVDL